jgi:hypothetical protein
MNKVLGYGSGLGSGEDDRITTNHRRCGGSCRENLLLLGLRRGCSGLNRQCGLSEHPDGLLNLTPGPCYLTMHLRVQRRELKSHQYVFYFRPTRSSAAGILQMHVNDYY